MSKATLLWRHWSAPVLVLALPKPAIGLRLEMAATTELQYTKLDDLYLDPVSSSRPGPHTSDRSGRLRRPSRAEKSGSARNPAARARPPSRTPVESQLGQDCNYMYQSYVQ